MTQKSYHIDKSMDPFEANTFEVNDLQETFSDLQTDLELKVNFSKELYESFLGSTKNKAKVFNHLRGI